MGSAKPQTKEQKKSAASAEEGVRAQYYAKRIKPLFTKEELAAGETKKGADLGREKTKARATRALYLKCATVGDFKKAGGDMGYLRNDPERGIIEVK